MLKNKQLLHRISFFFQKQATELYMFKYKYIFIYILITLFFTEKRFEPPQCFSRCWVSPIFCFLLNLALVGLGNRHTISLMPSYNLHRQVKMIYFLILEILYIESHVRHIYIHCNQILKNNYRRIPKVILRKRILQILYHHDFFVKILIDCRRI